MINIIINLRIYLILFFLTFYANFGICERKACSHEQLVECSRLLGTMSSENELSIITTGHELEDLCLNLRSGMTCVKNYTHRCMEKSQQEKFYSLFKGVKMAIVELCQENSYQEAYGRHAPCVQSIQSQNEACSKQYHNTINRRRRHQTSDPYQPMCCAWKEFLECSHRTVYRACGEETAVFTKNIMDQMSYTLMNMHCKQYIDEECVMESGSWRTQMSILCWLTFLILLVKF